jgi:nucleotide-binding universal stress UspA family protein
LLGFERGDRSRAGERALLCRSGMETARKTILVPVDFEGASRRAIEAARWLAGPLGADLVLVHAHERHGFSHPELPDELVTRIDDLAEQAAQKSLTEMAGEAGATRALFRFGDPSARILEAATEIGASMIVMGTHGRSGLGRLLMGSVAAEVVRAAPVPVLTVRAEG